MPDLSVDVEGLAAISGALREVQHGLDDTKAEIEAAGAELGSAELASALEAFESHWSDGRGQIRKNLHAVMQTLDTAAEHYRAADAKLARSLEEKG